MNLYSIRRIVCCCTIALAASFSLMPALAQAQDNWAADDDAIEARKIERYQQLVDQSPEKSYAFNQLMATVGKGAQYQKLLADYEKKVSNKPNNFNLIMILGHMYQYGGRTNEAIAAYKKAIEIKQTPLAYMSIAAAEAENRNFEPAVQAYEAASKLNPNKEQKQEIWRALAEIAIYRRDIDRAKTYFAELIKLEPNSLFVRRELSQIYAQNRLYADAREVLEEGKKLSSTSAADKEQIELDVATLYEQEGNDDEALSRYENLSQRLPSSHWMQRELSARIIDIHRRKGDVSGLVSALEKQWKSPTYQQHLELADLYDETSQPEQALSHIKKAISMSPRLPEAHEKLVRYYRSHGQMQAMFDAQKAMIKAVPDNPDYRFELYEAYIQQHQTANAIAVLDETQKAFASKFDVQRRVAEYYQINGRSQKALAIYESWVKSHPSDLQALEALGDHYDTAGERQKAAQTWKKIESLPMDNATKLETLARIYDEHGYSDEAEAMYARSLAANSRDCYAHSQYADVLTRNGKQTQAIEAWQKLSQTCQNDAMRTTASRQLAALYKARGMQQSAIQQYRGQCESSPNDLNAMLMFSKIAQALDMPAEAIPTLEAYVQRNPDQTEALASLHTLYVAAGDLNSARGTLEKMSQVSEVERREALIAMSEIDLRIGDLEAAQNHLSEALKLNASDADTHEKLGDVLLKRRLYEEAANNYETAFQIDNRNFHVAFKAATCLSILGKTKEADDIYVRIVTDSTDETLAHKAAQRAIDDHTWLGTLDELSKSFLPLLRSPQRKSLYLEILLSLADAQAQPHTLVLLTRDAQHALPAKHALRELSEKYASVIVESLLSDDPSISGKALMLSEWLTSANVVNVLGQKIEKAPTSETGRLMQLQAVRAIAHAQLPAAVPVLKSCMDSHYPRALREHAVWALGLIQSQSAVDALREALDINFDSFRAIGIIGLARQNAQMDDVYRLFKADPSPLVKDTAAWALAMRHYGNANDELKAYYASNLSKPHQLWALAQVDESAAATKIPAALWCSDNRPMAAMLVHSVPSNAGLTALTQPEAQGRFIHGATTHYQSNFDIDMLLRHFSELALKSDESSAAWLGAHQAEFVAQVQKLAADAGFPEPCRIQMLRDFLQPESLSGLDASEPAQKTVIAQAVNAILPQLQTWARQKGEQGDGILSGLSLRAMALTGSPESLSMAKSLAQSGDNATRLDAVDAIALIGTPESRSALRELAGSDAYLVRATAVRHLDPKNAEDMAVLQKAQNDEFAIVAETARQLLNR
ncbi:MAG: tetratricopeptide repeat protein [Proteobacteria bacterium]|nr:tetratricopeptide repeat protein [Pseudomonadota bacterium]